jgi:hypothetical protein
VYLKFLTLTEWAELTPVHDDQAVHARGRCIEGNLRSCDGIDSDAGKLGSGHEGLVARHFVGPRSSLEAQTLFEKTTTDDGMLFWHSYNLCVTIFVEVFRKMYVPEIDAFRHFL